MSIVQNCICKTGPKGLGPRCSKNAKPGSKFCGTHILKCLKEEPAAAFQQPKPAAFQQPKPAAFQQPKPFQKCICKTGAKGLGPRCTKFAQKGSKFCGVHLKKCLHQEDGQETSPTKPSPIKPSPIKPSPIKPNKAQKREGNFMEKRIENYKILKQQFSTLNPCLTEANGKLILTGYKHPIIFDKQIGSESAYGVVYMAHTEEGADPIYFSAKVMSADDVGNQNEIGILKDLTNLVLTKGLFNFPIMYTSLTCDSICNTATCPKLTKNKYIVVLNELANGDTHWWFTQTYTDEVYRSVILQMIYAIYQLHKIGYNHNDLHLGNFLIHKIEPGSPFPYTIYGKEITVPNLGYLVVLWDFGLSQPVSTPRSAFVPNDKSHFAIADYFRPLGLIGRIGSDSMYIEKKMKGIPDITQKWLENIRAFIVHYGVSGESEDRIISGL